MSGSLLCHGLQYAKLPFVTISLSLVKLMSMASVMPSSHLILCHPLCSLVLSIKVFPNESAHCIRPKYWSFSINLSNEYSGLILFRIDWFDLAVQGTLKSLLQQHNLKASILWCSAFFMVQLTFVHDYRKNHSFDYTDFC